MTIAHAISGILAQYDDPARPGLQGTPERVARMYAELLQPQPFTFTTFPAEGSREMIIQTHIPFFTLCEHHLLPFFGEVTLAYIPYDTIAGLSKLARTVTYCSRALQTQERFTIAIAEKIEEHLQPLGVAVHVRAQHLCMAMRGTEKPSTITTTHHFLGICHTDIIHRREFLAACPRGAV